MRKKCDRCGLRPPTVRKILLGIVHIGNQTDLVFEHVCTICLPVSRHVTPCRPA